ncbi:hypothetical protein [Nakamurella endophytica]|uniref:ATP synthase protein I n=1 Tax=Nakamurella endophytica TaxID=1748367 RepID=A0A917TES1_9ACTN|nr:hypothetical protein [Nakamurella endophytica]GGM18052.1 hypothetical protein GCM10011594_42660 [Nakamurella endophytica]
MRSRREAGTAAAAGDPARDTTAPQLRLAETARAADRSRTGGVWSLGHLRTCWVVLLVLEAVLAVVAGLVAGGRAVLGVTLGAAVVGLFFTVSAVVIARVGRRSPRLVMLAALGTYVVKVVALGVVLAVLPRDGAVDTRWLAGAVGLGVFGWLGAHMRYVWTTKIFYVDPG